MSKSTHKTAEEVFEQVQQLDPAERQRLKTMLEYEQQNGWASPEIEHAWKEEVRRRIHELEAGEVQTIPAEDVLREARERVTKIHK